jgi:hypothetical protein
MTRVRQVAAMVKAWEQVSTAHAGDDISPRAVGASLDG